MKLTVDLLNEKSIDRVIRKIQSFQKSIDDIVYDFCNKAARAITRRVYVNLMKLDLSSETIDAIDAGWEIEIVDGVFTLKNTEEHSTYLEFGTGYVGEQHPHDMAAENGWEYNIKNRAWNKWFAFKYPHNGVIDIAGSEYYVYNSREDNPRARGAVKIYTRGTSAQMFVYNAVKDFCESDEPQKIWKEILHIGKKRVKTVFGTWKWI